MDLKELVGTGDTFVDENLSKIRPWRRGFRQREPQDTGWRLGQRAGRRAGDHHRVLVLEMGFEIKAGVSQKHNLCSESLLKLHKAFIKPGTSAGGDVASCMDEIIKQMQNPQHSRSEK